MATLASEHTAKRELLGQMRERFNPIMDQDRNAQADGLNPQYWAGHENAIQEVMNTLAYLVDD